MASTVDIVALLICYDIAVLSLVMTACSGLSRRICSVDSVSFVYMVTGEFPYAWPSDLFRSTLCRCSILRCIMISLTGRWLTLLCLNADKGKSLMD